MMLVVGLARRKLLSSQIRCSASVPRSKTLPWAACYVVRGVQDCSVADRTYERTDGWERGCRCGCS